MAKNHRSGGKMGGRHTTVIDAAEKVVDFLLKCPEVSNVIAGHIKSGIGTAQQRIKIKKEAGCLSVMIRGGASIQEIKVFSQDLDKVQELLEEKFQ
jgi:hypothetical protein